MAYVTFGLLISSTVLGLTKDIKITNEIIRTLAEVTRFGSSQDLRNYHNIRLVRDTENIITTFTVAQSVTATAILGEENLHPDTCYNGCVPPFG